VELSNDTWSMQVQMLEYLERVWREPDNGIWETRGEPKRFTYSQAMIWAALDRMILRAEQIGLDAPVDRWRRLRTDVHDGICRFGFDAALNTFVRAYGSSEPDASLLLLPQIGFLPPDDPRIAGTIEAIGARLAKGGFIVRYIPEATQDGHPSTRRLSSHAASGMPTPC
jgi:GH15 family glucan-1,4-alpha-glucosidase